MPKDEEPPLTADEIRRWRKSQPHVENAIERAKGGKFWGGVVIFVALGWSAWTKGILEFLTPWSGK